MSVQSGGSVQGMIRTVQSITSDLLQPWNVQQLTKSESDLRNTQGIRKSSLWSRGDDHQAQVCRTRAKTNWHQDLSCQKAVSNVTDLTRISPSP